MEKVYLCLGGNIGDTRNYLQNAVAIIGRRIGRVVSQSAVYQSEPWGFNAEQMFLNQVVVAETELEPHAVLELCLQIEAELGRTRSGNGYEPRTIDIDIVFFGQQIISQPDLQVPHPLMHRRNFVLRPLCDVAADFVHPVLGLTVRQLADICDDKAVVRK
ncbi:MAG: 2-amino-4-hydroxy-6-hydroxymethyldihydropteridine diphosphokinase [Salinivirgaceae bacterium]|nr:2-amino-4-hydroxy-6-hydroxymethyldihydropteridine diphosphokinase [Salinivirgaceae bacterium]